MFIKTYHSKDIAHVQVLPSWSKKQLKSTGLQTTICILFVSLPMFTLFDFSTNQFQFVVESLDTSYFYIISSLSNQIVNSLNLYSLIPNQDVSFFNFYLGRHCVCKDQSSLPSQDQRRHSQ